MVTDVGLSYRRKPVVRGENSLMVMDNRPRKYSENHNPLFTLLKKYIYENERRWQDNERKWREGHSRWEYQQKVTQHLILNIDQHLELSEKRWLAQQQLNQDLRHVMGQVDHKVDQVLKILRERLLKA